MGFITANQLRELAEEFNGNRYGKYLLRLAKEGKEG
jgi:hypothetical protein